MKLSPISLVLSDVLERNDKYLPLVQKDMARLVEHLADGDETILTIQDNLYTEYVRAQNQCGTIVIERGVDSEARKFPRGACVKFEMSLPVVKWLICNYSCCEDGDCQCEPVSLQRAVLPAGTVGQPWEGRLIFNGSMPISYKVANAPAWMTAEEDGNRVVLGGTPNASGTFTVAVAATNCMGTELHIATHSVTINSEG